MSTYLYKQGQAIIDVIYIGDTGLDDSDFTKNLFIDGAVAPESVTVSEVVGANGFYAVSFTPASEYGDYVYWVWKTADTLEKYSEIFPVRGEFASP